MSPKGLIALALFFGVCIGVVLGMSFSDWITKSRNDLAPPSTVRMLSETGLWLVTQHDEPQHVPTCPEDSFILGVGSYDTVNGVGLWSRYVCGPAIDDPEPESIERIRTVYRGSN